ncbi:DUF659 domain-containing protein [Mycena indigotica]|uniref:DUF659 domain-containing protein n=1 Tax=Mycena indigotica TaxID=2126181 RepID=A0A8H6SC36_9AGAR|nr:DUF659 domain-containing protein [Mycena indigotica]KAF7296811.1 DUF659 domain-containing protein [Mycena indigotica]
MPPAVHPFLTSHFTLLGKKDNNSKRKEYACNHCETILEHRENRAFKHFTTGLCTGSPPPEVATEAYVAMAQKTTGKGSRKRGCPEDDGDEDQETDVNVVRNSDQPPAKKAKVTLTKGSNLLGYVDTPMSATQENAAGRKLLRYFIHSNTAFLNADNIFLADFTNELRPSYKVPSRTTMSTLLLDAEYSDTHLEMVKELMDWKRSGTLLIDGWEDGLRRSLYGTAVARVGEPTIVMGLHDLTGCRGSAEKIFDAAEKSMTRMGIKNAGCFLAAVTDNPTVMKAFRKKLETKYKWLITLACWAHGLNTLIGEICRFPAAKTEIQKANRVVTFFNGSHYWGGQLKAAALLENISRGLKKNCESRWYALILLLLSVSAHRMPLNNLTSRPDARVATNGFSAVNTDVVAIIRDKDDRFWPMVGQTIRIAKPFVDAIAHCEGRGVNIADCMLHFLAAARQLSLLEDDPQEEPTFRAHAYMVVDKRFRMMATPVHRLGLFLHPLCRKLAVLTIPGFTFRDIKETALKIAKKKWKWPHEKLQLLSEDIVTYHACEEPFQKDDSDAPLAQSVEVEGWEKPLCEADVIDDNEGNAVDAAFSELEETLQEEDEEDEPLEGGDDSEEEEDLPEVLTMGAAKKASAKKKAKKVMSLMAGEIYDFALVKKALDSVVPQATIQKINVVHDGDNSDSDVDEFL